MYTVFTSLTKVDSDTNRKIKMQGVKMTCVRQSVRLCRIKILNITIGLGIA